MGPAGGQAVSRVQVEITGEVGWRGRSVWWGAAKGENRGGNSRSREGDTGCEGGCTARDACQTQQVKRTGSLGRSKVGCLDDFNMTASRMMPLPWPVRDAFRGHVTPARLLFCLFSIHPPQSRTRRRV
jgi:hypothetical protein